MSPLPCPLPLMALLSEFIGIYCEVMDAPVSLRGWGGVMPQYSFSPCGSHMLCWGIMVTKRVNKQRILQAPMSATWARSTHLYNSGTQPMGVTNYSLIGNEAHPMGANSYLVLKQSQKPIAWYLPAA